MDGGDVHQYSLSAGVAEMSIRRRVDEHGARGYFRVFDFSPSLGQALNAISFHSQVGIHRVKVDLLPWWTEWGA